MVDTQNLTQAEKKNRLQSIILRMDSYSTQATMCLEQKDFVNYEKAKKAMYTLECMHDALLLMKPSQRTQQAFQISLDLKTAWNNLLTRLIVI